MGDNDRIALMQMVKEGKISTETALQVVSNFKFQFAYVGLSIIHILIFIFKAFLWHP
jgi:hypothetical protein